MTLDILVDHILIKVFKYTLDMSCYFTKSATPPELNTRCFTYKKPDSRPSSKSLLNFGQILVLKRSC